VSVGKVKHLMQSDALYKPSIRVMRGQKGLSLGIIDLNTDKVQFASGVTSGFLFISYQLLS